MGSAGGLKQETTSITIQQNIKLHNLLLEIEKFVLVARTFFLVRLTINISLAKFYTDWFVFRTPTGP